jgi:hypothetical protein
MTVTELIKKLSEFPGNMDVLVDGYEDGYDPVSSVNQQAVMQRKVYEWYNGEFDDAKTGAVEAIRVIVIKRPHRLDGAKEGK